MLHYKTTGCSIVRQPDDVERIHSRVWLRQQEEDILNCERNSCTDPNVTEFGRTDTYRTHPYSLASRPVPHSSPSSKLGDGPSPHATLSLANIPNFPRQKFPRTRTITMTSCSTFSTTYPVCHSPKTERQQHC
jgi:hypothetical protein